MHGHHYAAMSSSGWREDPGKQPGAEGSSRSLVDNPDRVVVIKPACCLWSAQPLADAAESGRERRQVVDVRPAPAPEITEYQGVSKICSCCGQVSTPAWETSDEHVEVVACAGITGADWPGDPSPRPVVDLRALTGCGPSWMWAEHGIWSYTFEMYPPGQEQGGFYPTDNVIGPQTTRNDAAVDLLLG